MNIKIIFMAVFDNLSKFAMLVMIYEFSRIFAEKYRIKWGYFASIGLATAISLLGYNGYSEYPRDVEYATIIFFTILLPSVLGIYMGLRVKAETLDQLIYTRRYFPEYRLLSDQEIVGIFRELYPKLTEISEQEIVGGLEAKYSSAPIMQAENDMFTLLPNTRKNFPEFKNLPDKYLVSIFKEKFPELKDSLDISIIIHLEKKYATNDFLNNEKKSNPDQLVA